MSDISNIFEPIDIKFAEFLSRITGDNKEEFKLAAMILSNSTQNGSICVDLKEISGKSILKVFGEDIDNQSDMLLPEYATWINVLQNNSSVCSPSESDPKPLVLDDAGRLYLYRYWQYERNIAERIKIFAGRKSQAISDKTASFFKNLFDILPDEKELDYQALAAFGALLNGITIITGGPGTGKTTTVAKMLILLVSDFIEKKIKPNIALMAPTGKAAARLKQAIGNASYMLGDEHKEIIKIIEKSESGTVHRLLGPVFASPYFKHDERNKLRYNIIVMDESSMADAALLSKLLDSIDESCKIIMLGDRDQLSSVEAGAVFADICGPEIENTYSSRFAELINAKTSLHIPMGDTQHTEMPDTIFRLKKSRRFKEDSGIWALASAIRDGDPGRAVKILKGGEYQDIVYLEHKDHVSVLKEISKYTAGYSGYLDKARAGDITGALSSLSDFIILSPLRNGKFGTIELNRHIENILTKNKIIDRDDAWYPGRPILINENDNRLKLYNGDTGLVSMSANGDRRVYFSSYQGDAREFLPMKLPSHETSFSMTVHKSQGSEFKRVLLVIPDRDSDLLSRELLYTAVTRAIQEVVLIGPSDIIYSMIQRPVKRTTALMNMIWGS